MNVNVMNVNKEVDGSNSDHVEELLVVISKKLNSLPPPQLSSHNLCIRHSGYALLQTKIDRIQPSSHDHKPSNNKGWIIKVFQNSKSSKLYLYDLFTNERLRTEKTNEKVLNSMNFRVEELFELYTQSYTKNEIIPRYQPRKVILFSIEGRCMVFTLQPNNEITASNIEELERTTLEDDVRENIYFDDILHSKEGQLYVVDKMGTIFWVNAFSLKLVQFSPKNIYYCLENLYIRVNSNLNKKQLVEYDGSLYVVNLNMKNVFVEVYKLDQEWGKWLEVKDLDGAFFVLGRDSNFALLAKDYYGWEGNCIYFYHGSKVFCFNLKNSKFKPAQFPTLFNFMGG